MKKYTVFFCLLCLSLAVFAQGEYDALKYSQTDIAGSARYVSMSGAFGALGGDMSSIGLNPAGIGVYRSSELSITPVVSLSNTDTKFNNLAGGDGKMNLLMNSFGYVGSFRSSASSSISNFNFGISYNKIKDFNRNVSIRGNDRPSSLLDRICGNLGNTTAPADLSGLGYLAYETYLINQNINGSYSSVLMDGELVNNIMYLREEGSVGEWDFTVGANWAHFLYVGASIGVQTIDYRMISSYKENSDGFDDGITTTGPFDYELRNGLSTNGGGVNVKIGAILRPFTSLRFGFALHSPTYYYLTDAYGSSMNSFGISANGFNAFDVSIDEDYSSYELITPGKIMYSVAYFVGKKAIISMDWDIIDYRETILKNENGFPYDDTNDDMYDHMRIVENFRLGGEYRLTENVSLRAGTAWYQSAYRKNMTANNTEVWAVSTTPHYSFDTGTRYVSGGIGYRTGSFFLDAAIMKQTSSENFFNFFDSIDFLANGNSRTDNKYASVDTKKLSVVVSAGIRF